MPSESGTLSQHVAHFYQHDDDLTGTLTAFVEEGLDQGEQIVLLATDAHWSAVRQQLSFAARRELKRGRVIVADAEEIVRRITVRGAAETGRFRAIIGGGLARVERPTRIFGEVARLIAARGELEAAVRIEQLGQQLAHEWGAHVACAYNLPALAAYRDGAKRIAACHDCAFGLDAATV